MPFYADLHVHSKYSRATSRDSDLEHMAWWARRKGLTVVGTGDFTHPAWWEEINEKLVPAEPGLYRLRDDLDREVQSRLPPACRDAPMRFMLEVEISTIYKAGEKTRKVHHLIYAAELATAGRFRDALDKIGNIASDGRPILGLDSRHLLEITLESGPDAYLVPAHIWTPWFAVLGSKSGFDSVGECYGDLAEHIFAVETGLSSDPPMNWRISDLDRYTLVSNSDAHSPPMLGREACSFDTELDYFALRRALETGVGYGGTVEFFPEEGKYHLDGHRACGVRFEPGETRRHGGRCPSCGKPLTVGVLHRVEELADRPPGETPEGAQPYRSLVQLPEIIAELHGVGPKSKTVERTVAGLVDRLGPEIGILEDLPLEDVERASDPLIAEAVRRLRNGQVRAEGGFDGEYGVIRLFEPREISPQLSLFGELRAMSPAPAAPKPAPPAPPPPSTKSVEDVSPSAADESEESSDGVPLLERLDPDQRRAAEIVVGALLIVAGPGTGKTRTLTHRLAHLVERGVDPASCLAVTFTRRAADEMAERLEDLSPAASRITVSTFHGLGLRLVRELRGEIGLQRGFHIVDDAGRLAILRQVFGLTRDEAASRLASLVAERRAMTEPSAELLSYREALRDRDMVDFDDLLALPVELLGARPDLLEPWWRRFRHLSIDEYQDIDALQYRLVRLLASPMEDGGDEGGTELRSTEARSLCAIGDPDQSIYRFRGADVSFFLRFSEDFPSARTVELGRNYRSRRPIVEASLQAIRPTSLVADRRLEAMAGEGAAIVLHEAASERAEAEFVVHAIEESVGGTSYFSIDSGRLSSGEAARAGDLSFDDFAILYRTKAQASSIVEALERSGIPYQKRTHERLMERDEVRLLHHELEARLASGAEGSVAEGLEAVRQSIGGAVEASRLDDALDLLAPLAERHSEDLAGFLSTLSLGAEVDTWDPRAERVSLLTLHAAKGLEFPVVFLIGCEKGLLPFTRVPEGEEIDVAEERRLFFVGLTRARERLFVSAARRRVFRGEKLETGLSEFVGEIAEELLERRRMKGRSRPREGEPRQLRLL